MISPRTASSGVLPESLDDTLRSGGLTGKCNDSVVRLVAATVLTRRECYTCYGIFVTERHMREQRGELACLRKATTRRACDAGPQPVCAAGVFYPFVYLS